METIQSILNNHNINQKYENAKKMDKENRIFMTDDYIIKIYYPRKYNYYYNELEVYRNLSCLENIPKLYYWGEDNDYKYIITSRLFGKSLFDVWPDYSCEQQKQIIDQMATTIKAINNIKTENVNFVDYLKTKYNNAIAGVNSSETFKEELNSIFNNLINYVDSVEKGHLIHIDVHFYNFMVNNDKLYAYDFENTTIAPLDYQLLRLYRMWKYPETFVYPKNSLSKEQIETFNCLIPDFINCYPEMTDYQYFDERMKLYLFVYLIEEAKRCNLSETVINKYIEENKKIRIKKK